MKITLITFSLNLLFVLCFGQSKVDSNPTIIGITIGDDYSKWSNTLNLDGTKNGFTKYFYNNAKSQNLFGYPIESIQMIFDSKDKLVAAVIETQEFKETGWRDVEFTEINGNIEYLFGKTDGWYESKTKQGNIIWSWNGNKNELYSEYMFQGSFKGSYIVLSINQKDFLDNIEKIPDNSSSINSKSLDNSKNPYQNDYSGTQNVITYAPILDKPDMSNGKTIGKAENNSVIILEKVNEKYYKVKSGTVTGYLWTGWFK